MSKVESAAMKKHVSITYHHTLAIKNLIQKEYWGDGNKRLYYYIDYTFRARYYDKAIYLYTFKNNKKIGIFCLNLYKNCDKYGENPLYLIFEPNTNPEKYQPFSVPDYTKIDTYCLTAEEISNFYGIHIKDIPTFYEYHCNPFNTKINCNLDWNGIFKKVLNRKHGGNTKDILYKSFNDNGICVDPSRMRQLLSKPFHYSVIKAINNFKNDNDYIIPALYFNKNGYKIVYQMLLEVEYPSKQGIFTKFVIVVEKNKNKYNFVRLINLEMASKNARLIDFVPRLFRCKNEIIFDDSCSQSSNDTPPHSISNTTVYSDDSKQNNGEMYPKFIRGEKTRVIDLINGCLVIENVTNIERDITSVYSLGTVKETGYIKQYSLNECDKDIRDALCVSNQIMVKSLHEICEMNNKDQIETISTIITSTKGDIKTSMKSFLSTVNKKGENIKYEILVGYTLNEKNINHLYLPKH